MAIDKNKLKKWTKVPLDLTNDIGEPIKSGAYMLVRAQGREYWTALIASIDKERAALGLTEPDATGQAWQEGAVAEELAIAPDEEGVASQFPETIDLPLSASVAESAASSDRTDGLPEHIVSLAKKVAEAPAAPDKGKKDLPQEVFNRIAMEAHIGRTFGGFYGVKDEDGKEISCRDAQGNLDVAACMEFLEESDDAMDQYVTVRKRLTDERDKRWGNARGN